jgi:hypothetical protein
MSLIAFEAAAVIGLLYVTAERARKLPSLG